MKKRYDIIFNAEKPTSEEIAKHQDFDALMKQFEVEKPATIVAKRQLGVRRWALVAASFAAIAVVSFAIQRQFFPTIFNNNVSENIAAPFVNPPIENLEMPFESVEIDAETGGQIIMEDGTKLILPKNAFVNKNGEKISGTVRLDYRKFQNLSDIFLSGIPMQYDSANTTYQMATVGMMELEGFYKDEPILINPEKAISVQLASIQDLEKIEDYNVYYLNETVKNWEYKAVDKFELVLDAATQRRIDAALLESEIVKNIAETQGKIKAIRNKSNVSETTSGAEFGNEEMSLEKPMPPKAPNPNNFVLDFDFSDFENPINDSSTYNANAYLTEYEDVIWEVSADQQVAYEKAISGTIWNNVDLKTINNQQFKLRLASGSRKVELILTPVLQAEELAIAQAKYRIALADYNSKIRANQPEIQVDTELSETDKLAIEALEKQMANLQTAYSKARIRAMKTMDLDLKNQKIINQFEVNQFGIWNCDKPKIVKNRQVSAKFQDATGKAVDFYMVYIANKTKGNVQRFYTNQKIAINYNENDENILWLVTKDGAIAVADNTEFEKIGNKKQHIFTLKNTPNFVQSKADLKEVLGL